MYRVKNIVPGDDVPRSIGSLCGAMWTVGAFGAVSVAASSL